MESVKNLICPICNSYSTIYVYYRAQHRIECFACKSFTPPSSTEAQAYGLWRKEVIHKGTFVNKMKRYFQMI